MPAGCITSSASRKVTKVALPHALAPRLRLAPRVQPVSEEHTMSSPWLAACVAHCTGAVLRVMRRPRSDQVGVSVPAATAVHAVVTSSAQAPMARQRRRWAPGRSSSWPRPSQGRAPRESRGRPAPPRTGGGGGEGRGVGKPYTQAPPDRDLRGNFCWGRISCGVGRVCTYRRRRL